MPYSPRRVAAAAVGSAALLASALGTLPAHVVAAPLAPLSFSTPTIVDPFRQGFEPNISLDQKTGAQYSSWPNGTPGSSNLYRSDDQGHDWRLVEDNIQGEPSNCAPIAGGDTELAVDPVDGSLYYADLQPLTNFNFSTSHDQGKTFTCNHLAVPDTGVDRQWFAIDSNGGTSAVTGGTATIPGGRLYFDYDDTTQSTSPPTGNVLVINASNNGLNFGSSCVDPAICTGASTRITQNEGLPGNLIVDDNPGSAHQHSIYALHSSFDLGGVVLSKCTGAALGVPVSAAAAQAYCMDPAATGVAPGLLNTHWTDVPVYSTDVNNVQTHIVSNNFTTIADDSAGNLYALWSDYPGSVTSSNPVQATYNYTGPGKLLLSHSTDGGATWSNPETVPGPNGAGTTLPNNTQPWLTAGSSGRVAVAWYGAPQAQAPDNSYGPDNLTNGVWDVYVAENLNDINDPNNPATNSWVVNKVSDHPAKLGDVSTEGLQLPTSPDRSLGDFMKISHDANGAIDLVYVDDNSQLYGQVQNAGPTVALHQTGGPSLIAGKTVPTLNDTFVTGSVTDPVGDARAQTGGMDLAGPPHLDITGSTVTLAPDGQHLTVTLTVNDPKLLQNLGPDPGVGGTSNVWLVRWDYDPASEPASQTNGSFFTAMEYNASGGQTFYDGAVANDPSPASPTLFSFGFPSGHGVNGGVNGNTITWTVPTADVGNPVSGNTLYEVQAVTATETIPSQNSNDVGGLGLYNVGGSEIAPNLVDQSPSFDAPLLVPATNVPEAPTVAGLILGGGLVAGMVLLVGRRRRAAAGVRS